MYFVIRIIGIVVILMALLYMARPDALRRLLGFFRKGNRIYLQALVRFALAVLFFVSARECKNFWVIFIFGILFLISGILILLLGPRRFEPILLWWQAQSPWILRFLGVIMLAVGIIIVIFA
jgi:hypothetical protein